MPDLELQLIYIRDALSQASRLQAEIAGVVAHGVDIDRMAPDARGALIALKLALHNSAAEIHKQLGTDSETTP